MSSNMSTFVIITFYIDQLSIMVYIGHSVQCKFPIEVHVCTWPSQPNNTEYYRVGNRLFQFPLKFLIILAAHNQSLEWNSYRLSIIPNVNRTDRSSCLRLYWDLVQLLHLSYNRPGPLSNQATRIQYHLSPRNN